MTPRLFLDLIRRASTLGVAQGAPRTSWRMLPIAMLLAMLAACASLPPPAIPEPLRPPKPAEVVKILPDASKEPRRSRPRVETGPTIVNPPLPTRYQPAVPRINAGGPVALTLDGVPLSAFINVVFGTELGFPLEIEQSLRARTELVSLRLDKAVTPRRLYLIAQEVLTNYGVAITEKDGLLRFAPADAASSPPRLITARALPDVPAGDRPVFVAMPLEVSEPGRIAAQVRSMFGNQPGMTLTEMVEGNALLIGGPPQSVQAAMDAVRVLDRASLRDRRSLRINPLYLTADVLARELREVLVAQGISVRTGPGSGGALAFVPVASANALIIFGESDQALSAAADWAQRLDQPSDENLGDGGVFMYAARYTTVETLVPVLETLLGGATSAGAAGAAPAAGAATEVAPAPSGSRTPTTIGGANGQIAVDPIRNVIIYQGNGARWRAIQGVLARLDQPARQVVIEVTVAEVTLTGEFANGVEWALANVGFNNFRGGLSALTGLAANAGGVVWSPVSSSGQVRAVINLFARDSRVEILSTPRLMVKSGSSASIDVGTEVPIVTSQATAPDLPVFDTRNNPSILQQIQYRKTGVLLQIAAVVHSGQRVDLDITQEVSEALQTDTSKISSPSIFSRKLKTSLSLSDGESMLLGGLISSNRSDGATKVPLLGDIPVVGKLFQNHRRDESRTELLMLITPYVVEDASQARAITDAIRNRFSGDVPDATRSVEPSRRVLGAEKTN
ncbi:MAG: type II secretion system protein GspD [Thermomonas sp.]